MTFSRVRFGCFCAGIACLSLLGGVSGAFAQVSEEVFRATLRLQVVIEKKDGSEVAGQLIANEAQTVAVLKRSGEVVVVKKTDVRVLRGQAQDAPAARSSSKPRTHDGFFLRMSLGPGFVSATGTGAGTLSGPSAVLDLAVGGSPVTNLAVTFNLFAGITPGPRVSVAGSSGSAEGTFSAAGIGGGVTYHFMPLNLYVSLALGVGYLSYKVGPVEARTEAGFAGQIAIGKEWWVSDNWGLGVAAQVLYVHSNDAGRVTWNATGGGIAFSATFN
jgi:small nuclear ribonucleoprotein (snRNP)-like protein